MTDEEKVKQRYPDAQARPTGDGYWDIVADGASLLVDHVQYTEREAWSDAAQRLSSASTHHSAHTK